MIVFAGDVSRVRLRGQSPSLDLAEQPSGYVPQANTVGELEKTSLTCPESSRLSRNTTHYVHATYKRSPRGAYSRYGGLSGPRHRRKSHFHRHDALCGSRSKHTTLIHDGEGILGGATRDLPFVPSLISQHPPIRLWSPRFFRRFFARKIGYMHRDSGNPKAN